MRDNRQLQREDGRVIRSSYTHRYTYVMVQFVELRLDDEHASDLCQGYRNPHELWTVRKMPENVQERWRMPALRKQERVNKNTTHRDAVTPLLSTKLPCR